MCKVNDRHRRAFWSIDAAFAFVLSVAMFAMLSSVLYTAGTLALKGADETSGALLSARFSSYALVQMERGEEIDLQAVLGQTGRKYISLQMSDSEKEIPSAGEKSDTVYCTQILYVRAGKIARLEACVG